MPKTTSSGPRAGTPWRHHAVSTPLLTAAGVYAAGDFTEILHAPTNWTAAGAGIGLLSASVAARAAGWRRGAQTYVTCCAATAGAWITWATAHTGGSWAFTKEGVASLAVSTLALGPLYPVVRKKRYRLALAKAWQAEQDKLFAEADVWVRRLAAQRLNGITVEKRVKTANGETLHLLLPEDGSVKFRQIVAVVENLTVAADLHEGAIRAEKGASARRVLLHVADRDVLAELILLPDEHSPLSINDPLPVGVFEDGQTATLLLREVAALIVGIRGSGKSNFVNVLLAALTRCVDAVIWMIDLKGGRTARPWLIPWLEGRTSRPVLDWVATTREEAERMLRAAKRVITGRAHSGAGGEKIVPHAKQPAIILVCEEIALLFGAHGGPKFSTQGTTNATLASLGMEITQLGRSEAVDPVLVTQRGTVSMVGSGDLKSQCNLRIGLGVATEADARSVFPDDVAAAADLSKLVHSGSFLMQASQLGRTVPAKNWRMEHDEVPRVAEAHTWIRPDLDDMAAGFGGADYANRWSFDRAGHLTGAKPAEPEPEAVAAPAPGTAAPIRTTSDLPPSRLVKPPPRDSRPVGRTADGTPLAGVEAQRWREIEAAWGDPGDVASDGIPESERAEAEADANPTRQRLRELLAAAGDAGVGGTELADQLGVARQTVQRWLSEEVDAGRAIKIGYGRYGAVGIPPESTAD